MINISEKIISEIIRRYQAGESPAKLARKFHVARSSVYRWIDSRTERDVNSVTKLSPKAFYRMQVRLERLQRDNDVFYACNCSRNSPLNEKVEEITRLKGKYGIHSLCRILKVNRSTYYHYIFRRPQKKQFELEDEKLRPMIKEIFEESKERFGSRKIRAVLLQKGIRASEKKISRLMKEMELVCKQVRLRYWSSTLRKYKCYDNKVKQEFVQPEPNLVWVSDITYARVKNRFCYVCIVIDLFSRRVLARRTAKEITSDLVWKTFEEAFERRKRPAGVTFHSDQGCQYTDFNFRKRLRQLGVIQSFSRPGTPLDNAVAESFFACMKREELSHNYYDTIEALEQAVSEYVEFYNSVRIHERLGYLTPIQVEENFYALKENKPVLWKCPNETVQNTVSVSTGGGEISWHQGILTYCGASCCIVTKIA